jgi:Ca2+-binding EF-hand superfamily protein
MSEAKKKAAAQQSKFGDELLALQSQLSSEFIKNIRNEFRQYGQLNEGRIQKKSFRLMMERLGVRNESFIEQLFDRFKLDKAAQEKQEEM